MIFLTEPSSKYRDSYIQAVREFQAEGRQQHLDISNLSKNFEGHIRYLQEQKERTKIPPDRVPYSVFWLIDDNEYVGGLSLRHELNDFLLKVAGHIGYEIRPSKRRQGYGKEILRLGLMKAKELGLKKALVTCDETNIGSKSIIEHNDGQFENAVTVEGSPVKKLRYWIDVA